MRTPEEIYEYVNDLIEDYHEKIEQFKTAAENESGSDKRSYFETIKLIKRILVDLEDISWYIKGE